MCLRWSDIKPPVKLIIYGMFKNGCQSHHMKHIIPILIYTPYLVACVGPRVPAYETKSQKFSWGRVNVWMSDSKSTPRDAKTGTGFLVVDMFYKERYLNKHCTITLNHVSMTNSASGLIKLDQALLPEKYSSLMREKEIGQYRNGQFHLSGLDFDFDRDSFPYDVNLNMNLDCPNEKSTHDFSKKIRFKMVQPVMWQQ